MKSTNLNLFRFLSQLSTMNLISCVVLISIASSDAAKILGVFHSFSKSHNIMGEVILQELASRGHEVTMMSGFPHKSTIPNYTDVYIPELLLAGEIDRLMEEFVKNNTVVAFSTAKTMDTLTKKSVEIIFQNSYFKKLVEDGQKFDLILIDLFLNDAHYVLSHLFNAPIIACSSQGTGDFVNRITHNPTPYAYVPSKALPYSDEMTFFQRLLNAVSSELFYWYGLGYKDHDEIVRKYFPNAPPMEELIQDIALVFSNTHVTYETPRPHVPKIINVGGCHVQLPKELPPDMKKFLDDAHDGAIFFSLGSNLKSSFMADSTIQSILKAFGKTKMRVLMKWENDELPNKPENVFVSKWFPQNDILAHPNIKLFITHGGLMSIIEAIYHGVPIIGIPVYADQMQNVPQAVLQGYGLQLDFYKLTEEGLLSSINEIVSNPRYRETIKTKSELLRDQPMKPLDLAVYWAEHVIKHRGAKHLNTKAHKLSWYQLLLLDVVIFIEVVLILVCTLIYYSLKKLLRCCKRNKLPTQEDMNFTSKKSV